MVCLYVIDGPRLPENVNVQIVSTTQTTATVQFSLTGPFRAAHPEQFVVMYGLSQSQLNSNSSVVTATSSSQVYSIPLSSLRGGTQYFYRIVATNRFSSRSTDVFSFLTEEECKCSQILAVIGYSYSFFFLYFSFHEN